MRAGLGGRRAGRAAVALKGVALGGRSAAAEVRALDAVRGRRHPHLLALFRAWRTADRLVVAAELADGSVCDRFLAVTAEGRTGIPPVELLRYLCESAEGLVFLNGNAAVAHRT